MTSSSSVPEFIENPTVVENIKCPRPVFKIIPEIIKQDDSIRAFSKISKGVVFAKDPRIYIHYNIEKLGSDDLKNIYKDVITDEQGLIKPEHKILGDLGFVEILNIPKFLDKIVCLVLSKVHGEFMWLDSVFKITKEAIKAFTSLSSIGTRLDKKKKIPNKGVMDLTGATFDNKSLRVNDITDANVKYVSMVFGYRVTHANRLNFVSSLCIHSAYEMVKKNAKIDIYEWLKDELLDNFKEIKGDKKGTFHFGNLLVCLMLYFTKEILDIGHKDFVYDIPIGRQIKEAIIGTGANTDDMVKAYLKKFQTKMKAREMIPQSIVDKYDKQICFVIKRDETWMEAVTPRTIWITKIGYEVDLSILEAYAKTLLDAPKEPSKEIFGSAKTIESAVSMQKQRKRREKFIRDASKMAKEVKENMMNISGILASELEGLELVAHVSPVVTSSDTYSGKETKFKRVEREKRKPSPVPSPFPKKARTLRKKQQAVREPKNKLTPKKKQTKAPDSLTPEELINEITQEGNLSNVKKYYHSFKDSDKETIEASIILHLDIYKKVLIEVVDDLPNDLYIRLEAKRMSVMELDKNLKVEALLAVHPINSREEIDELIAEANQTVFVSGHRQVSLMVGRVKVIADETADKWDIFFVEKEKKGEKQRHKMDKSFAKVYQKDKAKLVVYLL